MIGRVLIVMLVACSPVLGQIADNVVSGRIQVPKGGPAGSIPVTLTTLSSNNSLRTTTTDDGFFRFGNVRPGEYIVFAGAVIVPALVPGTNNSPQGIVLTPPAAILNRSVGTFFPGTTAVSMATPITVSNGARVEDVNFPLAASALVWGGPQFQAVPVKIVVDGGGTPTFHSDRLGLAFSDSPANVSFDVTFQDGPQKPSTPFTRIERTTQPYLAKSVVPMPPFPDGELRLAIPEGVMRVGQIAPAKAASGASSSLAVAPKRTYYIKSMTFGSIDLMKELMTIRGPVNTTLVITLARCTDSTTQEILCQ